jgi:hypothetical protein
MGAVYEGFSFELFTKILPVVVLEEFFNSCWKIQIL